MKLQLKLFIHSLALTFIAMESDCSLGKRIVQEKTCFTKYFWKIQQSEERSLNATLKVLRC